MLHIALIGCQIDGEGEQFDGADVGMRVQDEFDYIIHAVSIRHCVSNTRIG